MLPCRIGRAGSPLPAARLITAARRYFLVGAGDGGGGTFGEPCGAPCGAGVGGGFTSCNSTSKIRVEFGAMSGPIARSPYARVEGMNN